VFPIAISLLERLLLPIKKAPVPRVPIGKFEVTTSKFVIGKRYWDVATYKWDVHNGKIDSISLVVKRTHTICPTKYQPSPNF
jgi:hypothetical protein